MKKFLFTAFIAVLALSMLTACGANGGNSTTTDLSEFYSAVESTHELPAMMDMDAELTDTYYPGLSDYTFDQQIMKTASMSSAVGEYVLLQCQSAEDAEAVAAILQKRADDQAAGGAWYPESVEQWSKAQVIVNGNYVALIAGPDSDAIADEFNALFK